MTEHLAESDEPVYVDGTWSPEMAELLGRSAETDVLVERIAAAADAAAERFMERYRRRPHGDDERFYDYYDLLSTFASELRSSPGVTGGDQ